jgi:hypothetical protein
LLLIVRTLFNDAITIAVWTGFHVCLPVDTLEPLNAEDRDDKVWIANSVLNVVVRRKTQTTYVLAPGEWIKSGWAGTLMVWSRFFVTGDFDDAFR